MGTNNSLDANTGSLAETSPQDQRSQVGELPRTPEVRVAPTTPEWPENPKCPVKPEPPGAPVPPASEGHKVKKVLTMLAECNACQARCTGKKALWQLARHLCAAEKKLRRELGLAEILVAYDEWYQLSQPFLDPAKTYDTDLGALIAALRKVRVPTGEGETIEKALKAVSKLSTAQLPMIPGYDNAPENWRRVAALHRELSRSCRGNTYFLSCRHGALAYSGLNYQAVSNINHALDRLGVIKLVRVGDQGPNGKASQFRYLLADADTRLNEDEQEVEI